MDEVGIAFDIGTDASVCSYKVLGDNDGSLNVIQGKGKTSMTGLKNRSAVLYRRKTDGSLEPFKYGDAAALDRFTHPEWQKLYAEGFKLRFHEGFGEWLCEKTPMEALIDYMSMMLDCLRDEIPHLMDRHWHVILTIPVGTDQEKMRQMKTALITAGIHKNRTAPTRFSFISEPMAVMLHTFDTIFLGRSKANLRKGPILFCDPGGGTTDFCLCYLKSDDDKKNWVASEAGLETGLFGGGKEIDDAFVKKAQRIVGKEAWERFMTRDDDLAGTLRAQFFDFWHRQKRSYTGQTITVPLNSCLTDVMRKSGNMLEQIKLTETEARALFDPTFDKIIDKIKPYRDIFAHLYLTGGLSENEYFRMRILEEFDEGAYLLLQEEHRRHEGWMLPHMDGVVRVVKTPGLAVLEGAIHYGQYPDRIANRVLQRTYGICYYRRLADLSDRKRLIASYMNPRKIYTVATKTREPYIRVFHVSGTVKDSVSTTEWHLAGELLPQKLGDTQIGVDVVTFDRHITDSKGKNAVLLMPQLPRLCRVSTYYGTLPPETAIDTTMKVYFKYKVNHIQVKLAIEGSDHEIMMYAVDEGT